MLIYLSTKDMAHILSKHLFENGLQNEAKLVMDFGIREGQIVAVAAAGEELPKLQTVADMAGPRTSGSTQVQAPVSSDDDDDDDGEDNQEPNADGSAKPKRKRRTKAEIEADRLKAEEEAKAEVTADPATKPEEQTAPSIEPNEADATPPFDVDEGANLRAEAELLPDAEAPVDTAEAEEVLPEANEQVETAPVADSNDPFADTAVSTEGDELFAQPGEVVTPVTEKADGFVKPSEPEAEDPFANFN